MTDIERTEIVSVANEPRFSALPPARIVPALADEGRYIASESSFYRVLRAHDQVRHRGRAQAPIANPKPPTTQIATGPRQVWCWDMTYLPTQVIGQWFYLYLILDLYRRKIVGFTVEVKDDSDHAAHLVKRTALAMLHWLGIKPSYSRPRVSDDNAYAEALFRTAKYRPEFPARGFESIDQARLWGSDFVRWYNTEQRHSGIRYVTPEQRHAGDDEPLLAARHWLYQAARAKNPARWSRQTRNWSPIAAVTLNPERAGVVAAVTSTSKSMPLAA